MWTKLVGLTALAVVIALCGATPALANCKWGGPNCVNNNSPWLTKAWNTVNQSNRNLVVPATTTTGGPSTAGGSAVAVAH